MNLVSPIPMNTEDPVSCKTYLSFYSFIPTAFEKAIAIWAENSTANPTQVMIFTTEIALIYITNPWSFQILLSIYTTPMRLNVVNITVIVMIIAIFKFCIITNAKSTTAIANNRFWTAIARI